MNTRVIHSPIDKSDIEQLTIGDIVYFSGPAFTCRSRLQRYIFDEGHSLPFSTAERNLLIHTGPVIRNVDEAWKLISFMPTSSIRFEKWGPASVKEWNLKAIIGKTTMREGTAGAMREHGCIHATPLAVSPNLWIDSIEVETVYLFDELGSIEAPWHLSLNELGPFLVDIDSRGNNYFDIMDASIQEHLRQAYRAVDIPDGFTYTKLY